MTMQTVSADPNEGFFTEYFAERRKRIPPKRGTIEWRRERDRARTAAQLPISLPRYKVFYQVNGRERESAWLHSYDLARRGRRMMQDKYGERNAIIFVD